MQIFDGKIEDFLKFESGNTDVDVCCSTYDCEVTFVSHANFNGNGIGLESQTSRD